MLTGESIIFFDMGWYTVYSRGHHLARLFKENGNRVFDINHRTFGSFFKDFTNRFNPNYANYNSLVDKVKTFYSFRERCGVLGDLNRLLWEKIYLKAIEKEVNLSESIFLAWDLELVELYRILPKKLLIYDACDDWSAFGEGVNQRILEREKALIQDADIVIVSAQSLYDRAKSLNPRTYIVRNGADFDHFAKTLELTQSPEDELYEIGQKPIVGFYGSLSSWLDYDLLINAADVLSQIIFVLIGPMHIKEEKIIREIEQRENILYLVEKPYSMLPEYLKYFDVCIIPFSMNLLNVSTNPIKLYEYLAAGKPVVSTPIPEVKLLEERGVIRTAASPSAFAEAIREMMDLSQDISLIKRRQEIAYSNSWNARYRDLERIILEHL